MESCWDKWVEAALWRLSSTNLLRSTRPISLLPHPHSSSDDKTIETFDGPHRWDRSSVEIQMEPSTLRAWLQELPNPTGNDDEDDEKKKKKMGGKLILFSGNDYLGLSTHPSVRKAAAEAAQEHGMGPRGSALICGYTDYHRRLEAALADLKKKEDCLLCPTGFSANMAFMSALGSVCSLLILGRKPLKDEKIAVFSDAFNHASIIDGIRLAERQQEVEVFVYRHCDMVQLDTLLSDCKLEKKVVITDSLFSMDGDFAPITELVQLRKKHGFLLAIDDAHATLVCGDNGGGIPEVYGCEKDVDICIGTLSKAAACNGGFIACSNKWRQLIQSRGRSFIFSTSLPVPIAAAAHEKTPHICLLTSPYSKSPSVAGTWIKENVKSSALVVARKEKWRRREIWSRVQDFNALTNLGIMSPIISVVVGSEELALLASRHMLKSGFHVTAIRPPTVPANSCRLRITLTATHTTEDVRMLVAALSLCIRFPHVEEETCDIASRL